DALPRGQRPDHELGRSRSDPDLGGRVPLQCPVQRSPRECLHHCVHTGGYVQVFSALIVIIAGAFVITIIYRVIQESRREKEVPTEAPVSAKSSVQVETQPPSSAGAGSKAPSVERPQSKESGREDASLIVTEEEETED
uniref:Testis expressed 29 n=1 Tax=Bos taurus TaxID=9913 RepID=A0AAA9TIV7_BOVIN